MKHLSINKILISTATSMVCSINNPAIAETKNWSGSGQITSGSGQGASVSLELRQSGNQIKFLSGPSQGEQASLGSDLNGSHEDPGVGTWYFERFDNELEVTLYQEEPYRIVNYSLD